MVTIRKPRNQKEFEQYYALRWRILREPWDQPRESEKDEHEAGAVHLMAWVEAMLVGVGRLHCNSPAEAQIRYMAVEEKYRNQGVGAQILRELEKRAQQQGARSIVLNARDRAVHFYQKHGYQVQGKAGSLFDSVDHWAMRKEL
jgi:ribosomal protein S18 acetylase RimI-like enzyme